LVGLLLLFGCAKDQTVDLLFKDPEKHYGVALASDPSTAQPVKHRSQRVQLTISGVMRTRIVVYVYADDGKTILCTLMFDVDSSSGPIIVDATCGDAPEPMPPPPPPSPDAGTPMPDAEAPPDLAPDTRPDTGSSPCQEYCTTMRQNCPMVYPDGDDDCIATCTAYRWPAGGDDDGNTIGCRLRLARRSPTEINPDFLCYQAGPSGGRFCGVLCECYCAAAARACPELEGDEATCRSHCQEPILHPAYRSETGNTMECRIFWLGEALKKDDRTICDRLSGGASNPAPLCHD
jgi:hypothetical protein